MKINIDTIIRYDYDSKNNYLNENGEVTIGYKNFFKRIKYLFIRPKILQSGLDLMPPTITRDAIITIKPGIYEESLTIKSKGALVSGDEDGK